jgi:3-dehydroquinate synthase
MVAHQHKSPTASAINVMWRSSLALESKVVIGAGTFLRLPSELSQHNLGKNVLVLTQPFFAGEKFSLLLSQLEKEGFSCHQLVLPDGEAVKSSDSLLKIWSELEARSLTRKDTILAIGGGALTDLAGFAASTYLRGINLVLVPTTLLSQVDAAIGGKTGINLSSGKNLAGSFYFPKSIVVDTDLLQSLPERQFLSGYAEVIKYGLLEQTIAEHTEYRQGPRPLLDFLESGMANKPTSSDVSLPGIVTSSIKMKLAVVAKDPVEGDLRRSLNLGHTLAHGIEKASDYDLTHGEAVAIGTIFACYVALKCELISPQLLERVTALTANSGLPVAIPNALSIDKIKACLFHDKKREGNTIKMVLPKEKLGYVDFSYALEPAKIESLIDSFAAL